MEMADLRAVGIASDDVVRRDALLAYDALLAAAAAGIERRQQQCEALALSEAEQRRAQAGLKKALEEERAWEHTLAQLAQAAWEEEDLAWEQTLHGPATVDEC